MDGHQVSLAPRGGATGDRRPGAGQTTPDQYRPTDPEPSWANPTTPERARQTPKNAERAPHMTNVTVIRLCSLQASLKTVKIH